MAVIRAYTQQAQQQQQQAQQQQAQANLTFRQLLAAIFGQSFEDSIANGLGDWLDKFEPLVKVTDLSALGNELKCHLPLPFIDLPDINVQRNMIQSNLGGEQKNKILKVMAMAMLAGSCRNMRDNGVVIDAGSDDDKLMLYIAAQAFGLSVKEIKGATPEMMSREVAMKQAMDPMMKQFIQMMQTPSPLNPDDPDDPAGAPARIDAAVPAVATPPPSQQAEVAAGTTEPVKQAVTPPVPATSAGQIDMADAGDKALVDRAVEVLTNETDVTVESLKQTLGIDDAKAAALITFLQDLDLIAAPDDQGRIRPASEDENPAPANETTEEPPNLTNAFNRQIGDEVRPHLEAAGLSDDRYKEITEGVIQSGETRKARLRDIYDLSRSKVDHLVKAMDEEGITSLQNGNRRVVNFNSDGSPKPANT